MSTDEIRDEDAYDDCVDEGIVLGEPAALLRALIEVEPSLPTFTSAIWRGVVNGVSLNHRADSLAGLTPEPS